MSARAPDPSALRLALLALRCLALVLPAGFRARHGAELRWALRERLRDAWESGGWGGAAGCWAAEAVDLVATALRLRAGGSPAAAGGVRALAALAVTLLLTAALLHGGSGSGPVHEVYGELVVSASDPAGDFTLTLRDGRLVGATLGGEPVPPSRLRQAGRDLAILDEAGRVLLAVEFELPGTIRWEPRLARAS